MHTLRFLTALLLVGAPLGALAQDYLPFTEGKRHHYEGNHSQWPGLTYMAEDTVIQHAGYTEIVFPRANRRYPMWPDLLCPTGPGIAFWYGSKALVYPSGDYVTINHYGDSIRLRPQAVTGESWVLRSDDFAAVVDSTMPPVPGNYYEATVVSQTTSALPMGVDSVKIVELQYRNANGITASSLWNGYRFKLSKNYGIVDPPSWNSFPHEAPGHMQFEAAEPIDYSRDAWLNFKVGQELHTVTGADNSPYWDNRRFWVYVVNDVVNDPSQHSRTITLGVTELNRDGDIVRRFSEDRTFTHLNESILPVMPGQVHYDSVEYALHFPTIYPEQFTGYSVAIPFLYYESNQYEFDWNGDCAYWTAGGSDYRTYRHPSTVWMMEGYEDGSNLSTGERLVYYHCGAIEQGTPLQVNEIIPVEPTREYAGFSAWYRAGDATLHMTVDQAEPQTYEAMLYDMHGHQLWRSHVEVTEAAPGSASIHLFDLAQGAYVLKLVSNKNSYSAKFVVWE